MEASELSKLGRDPRRETTEESSGQPAVIVDHDAVHQLVQIWKHSSHIALARTFANEKHVCVAVGRAGLSMVVLAQTYR